MKNILKQINYIFSPAGLFRDIIEEAEHVHYKIFRAIFFLASIIVLAAALNICHLKFFNLFLAIILNFSVLFLSSRPKLLAQIAVIGVLLPGDRTPAEKLKELEQKYFSLIFNILLWLSLALLVLGTLPVRSFPMAVPLTIICFLLLNFMGIVWNYEFRFAKKLTLIYIVLVLFTSFALCLPRVAYIKLINFYPFEFLSVSQTEIMISDIHSANKDYEDQKNTQALKPILRKVRRFGIESLNEPDKKLIRELSPAPAPPKQAPSRAGPKSGYIQAISWNRSALFELKNLELGGAGQSIQTNVFQIRFLTDRPVEIIKDLEPGQKFMFGNAPEGILKWPDINNPAKFLNVPMGVVLKNKSHKKLILKCQNGRKITLSLFNAPNSRHRERARPFNLRSFLAL